MQSAGQSIPSLDGIRAISVLIVVLSHAGFGQQVPGGLGVTIFFFLSGYLITTLLLKEYDRKGRIDIGRFYVRRFLRLAPPLMITLVIAYALVLAKLIPGAATWEGFAAQVLYLANYYSLFGNLANLSPKGTGVLWSLAVEEHFYLAYPLLFLVLRRRLSPARLGWLLLASCALVLAWRYVLASQPGFDYQRTFYATDTRIDSIMWGCILALVANPWNGAPSPQPPALRDWLGLGAGLLALLASLAVRDPTFRETLRYTVQGIALIPIFSFAVRFPQAWPMRPLNWPPMMTLGVYSYAIYLIHFVIIYFLQQRSAIFENRILLLAGALLLSIGFAAAIERFVESHLRRMRTRFH